MHKKLSPLNLLRNPEYATTRLLHVARAAELRELPPNPGREGEGGLRTQGCYKISISKKPVISVITVVLNAEKYLEESIKSVINQTYDNVEYIIIDGGSTDSSVEIIKKYEDFIDYWVSEPDDGLYDAINKGVKASRGDWLYVLGADDQLLNVLHKVAGYLQKGNEIYYGEVYLQKQHRLFAGKFSRFKLMFRMMSHQSIFYPRQVYEEYSYNTKYPYAADYELEMRCFNDKRFSFCYMPILVALYNDTDGVSANNDDLIFVRDKKKIIKAYFPAVLYGIYCVRYYAVALLKALGINDAIKRMISMSLKW